MNENYIISKYLKKLSLKNTSSKNLNDDIFFDKKNKIAISVDTYNEGVHFTDFKNPDLVIKKILRSSISDLIAKGVKPKYYFISAAAPKGIFNKKNLNKIVKSLKYEQNRYKIKISGGDTTFSKCLSFCVVSVGFSEKIIERNNAKDKDDIYVTGFIGDSYIGLNVLNKKIKKISHIQKKYFINKFYKPDISLKKINILKKFANSSIDISDGLVGDLCRLINNQDLYFQINLNLIPTSKNFNDVISKNKYKKINYIFNGDDYELIFTASKKQRKNILKMSKNMNQKISIIGSISNKLKKNLLIDGKSNVNISNLKGYYHLF